MTRACMVAIVPLIAAGLLLWSMQQADLPVADTPLTTQGARTGEVSFGDLAADGLAEAASTHIAVVPAVAFKTGTIDPGPFDLDAVKSLLQNPDETIAVAGLTGSQILAAMERSLSRLPLPSGALLQVAGMTVTYNPNARRERRVKRIMISGAPLDATKKYQVAMPLSLAKGGSGYFQIFDADNIVRQTNTSLADAIFSFAKARGHVSYTGQGRLVQSPD